MCSTRSKPTTTSSPRGVFTDDLIETWIDYKRTNEVDPIRLPVPPHEFGDVLRHLGQKKDLRPA